MNSYKRFYLYLLLGVVTYINLNAQVTVTDKRYFRIGSLQSYITAWGSERAWNDSYYEGLCWPADYSKQDNAVIKRYMIGMKNFTDASGQHFDNYCIYLSTGWDQESIWPVKLKQYARFEAPTVMVDGNSIYSAYEADVDSIDPTIIPDRIIINALNTSAGVTITQKANIYSQKYHDNYVLKEYTYTNTGFVDYSSVQVLNDTIRGLRVGWMPRYSCGREGADYNVYAQEYGQYDWVTVRGENYPSYANQTLTEADGPVEWLRCAISWFGRASSLAYDNVGGPYVNGNGRLASPQFVGNVILHVDKSPTDKSDDVYQPAVLGWHHGDNYPSFSAMTPQYATQMQQLYNTILSGTVYTIGGTSKIGTSNQNGRMWEKYTDSDVISQVDPSSITAVCGQWIAFGPWDLAPGQSVTVVIAEAVSGLDRTTCEYVGGNWLKAKKNPTVTYNTIWPDGTTKAIKYGSGGDTADQFKNEWFYTGMDSLLLTFSRAKRAWDADLNIPQPPQPPTQFSVSSMGDRIRLEWEASPDEGDDDFIGYRIYRAVGQSDTVFQFLAEVPKNTYLYDDKSAVRGFAHYYSISAVNNGSNNSSGVCNPSGQLESGRFYTRTTEPAYLTRQQGVSFKDVRVVPNPYNISAKNLQFPSEQDKLMFYNIPGQCVIKIYTERGELIKTIHHTSGSGDEAWKLNTSSMQVVVSGVYIAYIEVTQDIYDDTTGERVWKKGDNTTRKILVVR